MTTPELSPEELDELLSGLTPEIPDCRVLRLIGRGGMSYVYLGVQESLERQVAIKVIAPQALKDEVSKARFEREARTIAKLQHPCIVTIHAVGRSEQGLLYYVLPYLSKGHLGQRDLTRNDAGVIEVVRALLWALDYAHAHGVVHRDVKAANVLFDNADRPLLADFGIAASKRDRSRVTGDGLAVGSSAHMAPEQARAERVDGRADLYSLGVLTFEMVSGRLPFQNPDALGLAVMHAMDPVPRLPFEKSHWQAFIETAMAKRPDDRFQNAREMMAALERVVDQVRRMEQKQVQARAAQARVSTTRRWPRRLAWGAGCLAVFAAAFALWSGRDPASTAQPTMATAAPPLTVAPAPNTTAFALSPPATLESAAAATPAIEPIAAVESIEVAPGEAELAAAQEQIMRRRLTQPPGDNAYDSLRAAFQATPRARALPRLGLRWLSAATPYLAASLQAGKDEAARALYGRAQALADELGLRDDAAWSELEATVVAALSSRLRTALAERDLGAVRQVKADAGQWGVAAARLEPYWSQAIVRAKPGDSLRSGASSLLLARLPAGARAGLAVSAHAITLDEYAAFVAATGRASARCRIRTALVTLKRRSWNQPGFTQQGSHPVVCVSAADALAYAAWLGQRDGQRYRLPTAGEWQALGLAAVAPACRSNCTGTASVDTAARAASGARSHLGSAREWSAECRNGCAPQSSLGSSWRDGSARSGARGNEALKGDEGYDDIGFRLVRDVAAAEVEQR